MTGLIQGSPGMSRSWRAGCDGGPVEGCGPADVHRRADGDPLVEAHDGRTVHAHAAVGGGGADGAGVGRAVDAAPAGEADPAGPQGIAGSAAGDRLAALATGP